MGDTTPTQSDAQRMSDKFAPSYDEERSFMVIRRPDGEIIPPPPSPAHPAPRPAAKPTQRPQPQPKPAPPEEPTTVLRGPTPDEILADPLVRTVLDVFQGEVKRIHPRPNRPNNTSEE